MPTNSEIAQVAPSTAKPQSNLPIAPTTINASSVVATTSAAPAPTSSTSFKSLTPDAIANGFSTLIGALVGAMLAYALQRRPQKTREHKNSLMAGHQLMFALLQQINTVVLIQRDYIYSELKNPAKFLSIPATPIFDTRKNVLELSELAFLLENAKGRAILYEFYTAQENYIEAINQWNLRSTLHLEKVQPALAMSGIGNGGLTTAEDVKKALGLHTFEAIINATENCIESAQRAFEKLFLIKTKTRAYLVERFETKDFTDFDIPDTYGLKKPIE